MRSLLTYLLLTIVLHSLAQQPEELFKKGNSAYQNEDYKEAIESYHSVLNKGYTSASLYYNLGNAYYKTGQVPQSVLYYERAKKLDPSNEDIYFNLQLANLRVQDKFPTEPQLFIMRWWNNLVNTHTADEWAFYNVVLIWVTFFAAVFFILSKSMSTKKISFFTGLLAFLLFLTSVAYAFARYSYEKKDYGIIFDPNVYVKSAPAANSIDLFILHEGTKIRILDQENEWLHIRLPDNKKGWVKEGAVESI